MTTYLRPNPLDPATDIVVRQLQAQISQLGKQLQEEREERVANELSVKAILIALPAEVPIDQKAVYKIVEEAQLPGWSASAKEKAMKRIEGILHMRDSMMHRVAFGKL